MKETERQIERGEKDKERGRKERQTETERERESVGPWLPFP